MKSKISKLISSKLIYVITAGIIVAVAIFVAFKMISKVSLSKQPIQSENLIELSDSTRIEENSSISSRSNDESRKNSQETTIENDEKKVESNKNEENKSEEVKKEEQELIKKEEKKSVEVKKVEQENNKKEENKSEEVKKEGQRKNSEKKSEENKDSNKKENKKNNKKDTTKYISINEVKISRDMDLSKRTGLSRKDFIKLIANVKYDTSGFFEDNAGTIYDLCEKYSINEIFFCGLISAESAWNIAQNHRNTHNYISLMKNGKLIHYNSVYEGLEVAAQKLHYNYLTPGGKFYHGKTLSGVQKCFCPSYSWIGLVYGRMQQII